MTKTKLNEMYWTGYCDATIQHAAGTSLDSTGRDSRMVWAQQHFNECGQCTLANIVKALEYEAAARMGGDMAMLFQNGGDVTRMPGFQDALRQTMDDAIKRGIVSPTVYDWMVATAQRHGHDWPGLDSVEVEAPS